MLRAPPTDAPLFNTSPVEPAAAEALVAAGQGGDPERAAAAEGEDGAAGDEGAGSARDARTRMSPGEAVHGAICAAGACCELRPSDALLLPRGVWHHATSLSTSFSVSFW